MSSIRFILGLSLALAACSSSTTGTSGTITAGAIGTTSGIGTSSSGSGHGAGTTSGAAVGASTTSSIGSAAAGTSSAASSGSAASNTTSGSASSVTTSASGGTSGGSVGSSTTGGITVADPTSPGPYTYASLDSSFASDGGYGGDVPVHVVYPTGGPEAGPYPVILFAHGFTIDQTEYYSYLEAAASFGYVAMTVNYQTSLINADYIENTNDFLGGLTWLTAQQDASTAQTDGGSAPLVGLANTNLVGASGHSLGGKLAILAAAQDSRIQAAIEFDPVDGSAMCLNTSDCPNAAAVLPLPIPTGFLGETLDANPIAGSSQACVPASANYTTIYTPASSSFEITLLGAGHVSFLDSISACGFFCDFCQTPSAPQAQVLTIAHSYLVSFYERYLRGNTGYDTYLTGNQANALFVNTGEETITGSK